MTIKVHLDGTDVVFDLMKRPRQRRIIVTPIASSHYRITAPKSASKREILQMIKVHEKEILALKPHACIYERAIEEGHVSLFGIIKPLQFKHTDECKDKDALCVKVKEDDITFKKAALKAYLKQQLMQELQHIITQYQGELNRLHAADLKLSCRYMKTKFGSCQPKRKRMSINLELVHYPKQFLHYIFLHEMTHLIHPDHSANFYKTLEMYYPNHRNDKQQLNQLRKRFYNLGTAAFNRDKDESL